MPRTVVPLPLTRKAFAPFGDVIETDSADELRSINEGNTVRFHDLAKLNITAGEAKAGVSIFRSQPVSDLTLKLMERHPLSSQAFYPLGKKPYLVAVAPAGNLDPNEISVFIATACQGVNYHAGTWHHYLLALEEESDFLVIDRIADDSNCDEVKLEEHAWIRVELV